MVLLMLFSLKKYLPTHGQELQKGSSSPTVPTCTVQYSTVQYSTVHRAHLLHEPRAALAAAQESVGIVRGTLGHKVHHWVEVFLHSNFSIIQTSTTI